MGKDEKRPKPRKPATTPEPTEAQRFEDVVRRVLAVGRPQLPQKPGRAKGLG